MPRIRARRGISRHGRRDVLERNQPEPARIERAGSATLRTCGASRTSEEETFDVLGDAEPPTYPLDGTSLAGYLLRGDWKYYQDADGTDYLFDLSRDSRE